MGNRCTLLLIPSVAEWTQGIRARIRRLWLQSFPLGSKLKRVKPQPGSLPHEMDAWQALRTRPAIVYSLPPSPFQLQKPSTLAKEVKSNLLDLSHLRPSDCLPDSLDFDPIPIKFLLEKAPVKKLIPATSLL